MSFPTSSVFKAMGRTDAESVAQVADLYLNLLEQTLTGLVFGDPGMLPGLEPKQGVFDVKLRVLGMDWPLYAQTMVGVPRLHNLRLCIAQVLQEGIPGDFIETGVWRGGASIYMRANLEVYGERTRKVWVCDSFEGLPPPDAGTFPLDANDRLYKIRELAVSLEEVRTNFARYGLLDQQVMFLKGFFKDTLHSAPIDKIAIARLDGDMYESTIQALDALYPKVSQGGYIIIDDYSLPACAQAVTDYCEKHTIKPTLERIDHASVFWRKY